MFYCSSQEINSKGPMKVYFLVPSPLGHLFQTNSRKRWSPFHEWYLFHFTSKCSWRASGMLGSPFHFRHCSLAWKWRRICWKHDFGKNFSQGKFFFQYSLLSVFVSKVVNNILQGVSHSSWLYVDVVLCKFNSIL